MGFRDYDITPRLYFSRQERLLEHQCFLEICLFLGLQLFLQYHYFRKFDFFIELQFFLERWCLFQKHRFSHVVTSTGIATVSTYTASGTTISQGTSVFYVPGGRRYATTLTTYSSTQLTVYTVSDTTTSGTASSVGADVTATSTFDSKAATATDDPSRDEGLCTGGSPCDEPDETPEFRQGISARSLMSFWRERESDSCDLRSAAQQMNAADGPKVYQENGPFRYILDGLNDMMDSMDSVRRRLQRSSPFGRPSHARAIRESIGTYVGEFDSFLQALQNTSADWSNISYVREPLTSTLRSFLYTYDAGLLRLRDLVVNPGEKQRIEDLRTSLDGAIISTIEASSANSRCPDASCPARSTDVSIDRSVWRKYLVPRARRKEGARPTK
ncbi:hypothetical protein NKR23_g3813 [Pleurostoma richardsiae]|uniref:Uncharacterized protein n=1 Tax=Pleurostoma richardsiae TaxID=41990 RepID=A0AA38RKG2_9PEZI|nr:hypothetical protein NKR23_g3813 [Pleurostoma richardsiae]